MARIDIRGTELYVEDSGGGGAPVVLLHGFLFDGRMYDAVVDELQPEFRCIRIDFPGQGRSGPSGVGYATDRLTDLMIAALDQLGLTGVHLVGLSMGGFTGMRIAVRRPDLVASLALLNTSAAAHPRSKFPKQLALASVARLAGTSLPPITSGIEDEMYGKGFRADPATKALRDTWRQRWADSDRSALVATLLGFMFRSDFRAELAAIGAPTLIIAGGADASLPLSHSSEIHRRLPDAPLVVLPGVGHSSPLEAPHRVADALRGFWADVLPQAA